MKPETSIVKAEANRKNAQLSTGPKTAEGKAAVKWNAVKHGLLAKEAVIRTGDGRESKTEFSTLLASLTKDLKPEGVLEEMLVEKIAVCYWRLRRALRCEVGEIRGTLDTYDFDRAVRRMEASNRALQFPSDAARGCEKELIMSTAGIQQLLNLVEAFRVEIDQRGILSEQMEKEVPRVFGTRDGGFGQELFFYNWLASEKGQNSTIANSENSEERLNPAQCREIILEMLAEKTDSLENALDVMQEHEEFKAQSDMAKLSLPGVGVVDRILRVRNDNRAADVPCDESARTSAAAEAGRIRHSANQRGALLRD